LEDSRGRFGTKIPWSASACDITRRANYRCRSRRGKKKKRTKHKKDKAQGRKVQLRNYCLLATKYYAACEGGWLAAQHAAASRGDSALAEIGGAVAFQGTRRAATLPRLTKEGSIMPGRTLGRRSSLPPPTSGGEVDTQRMRRVGLNWGAMRTMTATVVKVFSRPNVKQIKLCKRCGSTAWVLDLARVTSRRRGEFSRRGHLHEYFLMMESVLTARIF
jgi:hypothetical protein